tara:strand:- start:1673 stop:2569 length:897 start_codon:yes stop_codon:yes gene_type:complete
MDKQTLSYVYAVAAVLLWSTVASVFKLTLQVMRPIEMVLYASFVSVMVLFGMLVWQKRLRQLRTWSRCDILRSAFFGFLNPFLYYFILFKSYVLLPAQEAQALNFTWPIVLVLFSIVFLKQQIALKRVLAMMVSFVGVLVIATRGNIVALEFTHTSGVILALGSALIWAMYWIGNLKDSCDPVARLFMNFVFGCVFVTGYVLVFDHIPMPPFQGLWGCLYVGLFEMGLTFLLWLRALQLSQTTDRVSSLIYVAPFLSLLFIYFIVGESIFPSTIVGLILIIAGIIAQHGQSSTRPSLS